MAIHQTDITASTNNQDPRRQIRIKDINNRTAIVTLWGKHAEQFEAETLYQESTEHDMVILFTGMTVSFSWVLILHTIMCHANASTNMLIIILSIISHD